MYNILYKETYLFQMSHLKDVGFINKSMSGHHNLLRKVLLTQVTFEIPRSCLFI